MIRDIQDEILRLKKEKDICILAHSYLTEDITEIADFTGDSFALAVKASKTENQNVLMCGVRFMAEGVKLLCPEKRVILSRSEAGCPMAEQFGPMEVSAYKRANPGCAVVAYINTSAALKTECDVCVTSSSAVKIVSELPEKDILFIPDCNLGRFVQAKVPEKNITLWDGGCPVHSAISADEAAEAKAAHPSAPLLVHPECVPDVIALADFVGSTSEIMNYAISGDSKEYIIGTELAIAEHLQFRCPDKKFYPMSKRLLCPNMKLTTLKDVYDCVSGTGGEEIVIDEKTASAAKRCIERMIALG